MVTIGRKIKQETEFLDEHQLGLNMLLLGENADNLTKSIEKQLMDQHVRVLTIDFENKDNEGNYTLYDTKDDYAFFQRLTSMVNTAYDLDLETYYRILDITKLLDNLCIDNYRFVLRQKYGIDLELDDRVNKDFMLENRKIHLSMKTKENKLVNLMILLDQLSYYFEEHVSRNYNTEYAVIVKGVSNIAGKKTSEVLYRFLLRTQMIHNMSFIVCDDDIKNYNDEILCRFFTKIVSSYKYDLDLIIKKIGFNELNVYKNKHIAYVKTLHQREYEVLVNDIEEQEMTYAELLEHELTKRGYFFLKLNDRYLVEKEYMIMLGRNGLYFSHTFLTSLDEKEEKVCELLCSVLNRSYGYIKLAIIDKEMQALCDDVIVNNSSISNFVYKLDKLISVVKDIERQLKTLQVIV